MSLQGITEYKERLISSTYDASLTSGIQSIYQTEYSLDNKNMTKYLKNYYLTNEGMSAIVDNDNNIKSFVSSASLHVSQLWILDENKSQEIMVDISENNLVKKINEYMIAHPDENYEVVIGGAQSKKKQYYINDGEQDPQGIQGPVGETGPQGIQGPAYVLTDTDKALITNEVLAQFTNAESTGM